MCRVVYIVLLFTVVAITNVSSGDNIRGKRQVDEDRWEWGYFDEPMKPSENASLRIEVTTTTTTKREEDEPEPSFCQTYNPDRPNFNKPGRRICEAKCYEYIWKLNVRLEEDKRFHQCLDWKRKKYQIQFAIGGHPTGPGDYPHMFYKGLKPTDRNITRIIVHPQFSPPKKYFDIALMELDKEVIFSRLLQPACLWTNFDTSKLGKEAVLTGWGIVATGSLNISPELQAATVDILDSQLCDNFLKTSCNRNWCGMQDDQLCAGKLKGGVDACQGDSGGPLQVKIPLPTNKEGQMHYVLGVISFGIGCAYPNLPGIYTRVSTFIDWIEDNVWGNS
ncbi:tryptase-2-like isoform X3 [Plodia interpunctella]|uniref:tryptase-2-like isoform X3 n=1 Tax=Plodia interpunctella TaxID=58824 RepID=UPI002367BA38|nr:tryptase-2-like isoform X3 [Plodia interpunctella]